MKHRDSRLVYIGIMRDLRRSRGNEDEVLLVRVRHWIICNSKCRLVTPSNRLENVVVGYKSTLINDIINQLHIQMMALFSQISDCIIHGRERRWHILRAWRVCVQNIERAGEWKVRDQVMTPEVSAGRSCKPSIVNIMPVWMWRRRCVGTGEMEYAAFWTTFEYIDVLLLYNRS